MTNLINQNYFIKYDFLSNDELKEISQELDELYSKNLFQKAGIGKNSQINNEIRGDDILWLDFKTETQKIIWNKLEELKNILNKELYLGLWDFEGHYAVYPKGSFYKRHLDTFKSDDKRTVSFVLYLNQNWQPADGGELLIYQKDKTIKIEPMGGSLVCFLSKHVEHEVLTTQKTRKTFTGWFRVRSI